jgi:hypothetical protein
MFNSFALSIEILILLSLALLAFERSRRWAVYGDNGKLDGLLVGAVGFPLFLGALMLAGHWKTSTRLADPYFAANLPSWPLANSAKLDDKLRAQREYLATGYASMYMAGSAKIRYVPTDAETMSRSKIVGDLMRRTKDNDVRGAMGLLWLLGCLSASACGFALGRQEHRKLTTNHGFQRVAGKKTFAEVDGLINMLRGACEDPALYKTLELILTQPDRGRKAMLRELIAEMRAKQAPRDLIDAFICLMDDGAAEKAYTVIYKCERAPAAVAA